MRTIQPSNQHNLTVCVICRDSRSSLWVKVLINYFADVYVIASSSDYRKFSISDIEGVIIPERKLPASFSVILFHSNDEHIWHNSHVTSNCVFEFNTPGTPKAKSGILPILRQTSPNFAIEVTDVEEIVDYLSGNRETFPSVCYQPLELLPAISLLFHTYIATHLKNKKVSRSSWWFKALAGEKGIRQEYQDFKNLLKIEWIIAGKNNIPKTNIDTLIQTIFNSSSSLLCESAITPEAVSSAYQDLVDKLGLQPTELAINSVQTSFDLIISIKNSLISTSVGTVLSTLLDIPQLFLDGNEHRHNLKSLKQSILVIPENQIAILPKLRLKGFTGAVLVLSSIPFSILKQQHRVLRFGYGSHDSCETPLILSTLLEKVTELVPLERENFQLLQKELRAAQKLRDIQITSCMEHIKHLKKFPQDDKQRIQEIEKTVDKLRADARVACHTIVTIDQDSRQLQQHFQVALNEINICDHEHRQKAINRLETAFIHLNELLQSTGEKYFPFF
ncbi:hypothetical protein [Nostoc parmelioides]|uniref:Uncharacterized protein n=1 Tax=Nostoc parmelioides FACHB-3921 TaxID=2692909 RepID=A0ABR8BKQ1_9NOSO|nr:hypothetical protein [Nostoc parmelioides]MBD2254446.1 hypothetical protein [Nostoc parmelioides FACHB-3921]